MGPQEGFIPRFPTKHQVEETDALPLPAQEIGAHVAM